MFCCRMQTFRLCLVGLEASLVVETWSELFLLVKLQLAVPCRVGLEFTCSTRQPFLNAKPATGGLQSSREVVEKRI